VKNAELASFKQTVVNGIARLLKARMQALAEIEKRLESTELVREDAAKRDARVRCDCQAT
jgi:hypothetical protein